MDAAWAPDSKTLAALDSLEIVVAGGEGKAPMTFSTNDVPSPRLAGFTRDGKQLLFTSCDTLSADVERYAALLDVTTGKVRAKFSHGSRGSPGLFGGQAALSPQGKLAASAFGADIHVWKTADGSSVRRLGGVNRSIGAAAWGKDGKTVGWGHTLRATGLNALNPLERSFHLEELGFGARPDASYTRTVLATGPYKLAVGKGESGDDLVMRKNGAIAGRQSLYYSNIFAVTLLSDGRAVAARPIGLSLFDLRTAPGEFVGFPIGVDSVMAVSTAPDNPYLLVGNEAGMLQIVPQERLKAYVPKGRGSSIPPLLSLCLAGSEWIAWTPEGYYAASPGGEKLMGWHVNNGANELATFHPAARFHKTMYRPDVIKKLLAAGSVDRALAAANKDRGQETAKVEVAKVLPPQVAVTSHKSGERVAAGRFEVKASARGVADHPVTALRLLVDGRPYGGDAGLRTVREPRAGEVRDSWTVELPSGPRRLAVVAASAASEATSDEVEVVVAAASTSAKPPTAALHLLAVGINAYPGRLKLDCAAPDAKAVAGAFAAHSKGLFDVRTNLLIDREATRGNVLKGLETLEKQAKPGDVAVVFYAGHGDCKAAGQFVLVSVDADVKRLAETGVTGEEIRRRLAKLPCTALLIMDCCYAGSFDAAKKKRALPTEAGDLVRELVSDDQGLVVMCGASKEQEAGEESKLGHGYFTLALTEGLGGKAASKRDGLVYLTGLQLYVEERVRELSKDEQYPTIGKPTLIRSFPLARP